MNAFDGSGARAASFLLVDDHEMCRIGMRRLIERRPGWRVSGETGTIAEAEELARERRPQVAIVDLRLKDGDGLRLVRRLRAADPTIKILVVSVNDEELFAQQCLHAGASGYLAKGQPAKSFISAVERTLAGGIYLSDALTQRLLDRPTGPNRNEYPLDTLTVREREVYGMIGSGLSVKQIARELGLSAKTVEYHRQQLKKKLRLSSSVVLERLATVNPISTE